MCIYKSSICWMRVNINENIIWIIYEINWLSLLKLIRNVLNNLINKFRLFIFSWIDFLVCVGICIFLDFMGFDKKIDILYINK